MLLLVNNNTTKSNIEYAHNLLQYFVSECKFLYGEQLCIYNFHLISHIADDALMYGSLDNVSAFKFENFLGKIKKLVHTGNSPLQQIINRIEERKHIPINTYRKMDNMKVGHVYIINNLLSVEIEDIKGSEYKCKKIRTQQLYLEPCDSTIIGIFKAYRTYASIQISKDSLKRRGILINIKDIYEDDDDDYCILLAVKHLF